MGGKPGIFWFLFIFSSLWSSALDHSATAPPQRTNHVWKEDNFWEKAKNQTSLNGSFYKIINFFQLRSLGDAWNVKRVDLERGKKYNQVEKKFWNESFLLIKSQKLKNFFFAGWEHYNLDSRRERREREREWERVRERGRPMWESVEKGAWMR